MARFLMAWELGSGLGHAGRMAPLARELMKRGHQVDVVMQDVVHARSMFHGIDVRIFQAPMWLHRTVGLPHPQVSLAEILLAAGYLAADSLSALVSSWQALMQVTGAQAVIGDYAPTALLAAHISGLPSAAIGIGFYIPPEPAPGQPLLPFRTWEPIQAGRVQHYDQQALDVVNTVIQRHGGAPLGSLGKVYRGDRPLLCTWEELDHFGRGALPAGQRYHGPSLSPTTGETPLWPDGDGPRAFAYIRQGHPDHQAVLNALVHQGCRTLVYMPEVGAGAPPPVQHALIRYSRGPVHMGQAMAQARLLVCHAGAGVMTEALLAGVPVLMLPAQAEQFLIAMRVHQTGAGINAAQLRRPPDFAGMLAQLLAPTGPVDAAQALARKYAGFSHDAQMQELASEFEALLPQP
jgi:UDP:flavonoid glycosyltransferase YjiC (YdhE family)